MTEGVNTIKTSKFAIEVYKRISANAEYVKLTAQMDKVHDKKMTLVEIRDEIDDKICMAEDEWSNIYDTRLALKNILEKQITTKFMKDPEMVKLKNVYE